MTGRQLSTVLRRDLGLAALLLAASAGVPLWAAPAREPGPATVAMVHSDSAIMPRTLLIPERLYPLSKQDYRVVARMLDRAVIIATGVPHADDAWHSLVKPSDRVGVLFDPGPPPASLVLLDAVVSAVVDAGVRPPNVTVWAESEAALFAAGVLLQRDANSVKVLGADSEGFRNGISRIALSGCDVIITVSGLRPDRRTGFRASVTNQLAAVPEADREQLLEAGTSIAAAASRPTMATKCRLHLLDALQPAYEPGPMKQPPHWDCGRLLASVDCVALDVVGAELLEEKRAQVQGEPWPLEPAPVYLEPAMTQYRLGQADRSRITVVEDEVR